MASVARSLGKRPAKKAGFDVQAFLESTGVARKIAEYGKKQKIFSQGEAAKTVMYIQKGAVKLSIVNETGREAVACMVIPSVGWVKMKGRVVSVKVSGGPPEKHGQYRQRYVLFRYAATHSIRETL